MNIEEVRDICLNMPGVTEDMPFGDDVVTFRIEGKIFICLWLGTEGEPHFALKLSPERNIELREQYTSVTPAYHWNKVHWSDVYYCEFSHMQIKEWLEESYRLVLSKLPKAVRQKYL